MCTWVVLWMSLHAAAADRPGVSYLPSPTRQNESKVESKSGDDYEELLQHTLELQKTYDSINLYNPLSGQSLGKSQDLKKDAQKIAHQNLALTQLQQILSNPAVQTYLKFFSNASFSQGMAEIVQHPARMVLLYAELGLLLFMIIFRAWRFSKAVTWVRRLWVHLYTLILGAALAIAVVPSIVLGASYWRMLAGFFQVLLKT